MLRALAFVMAIVAIYLPLPVAAHPGDHGTISVDGGFTLGPAGATDDSFHAYLSTLGIPFGPGDVLEFRWRADEGTEVEFDIHTHDAANPYNALYRTIASERIDSWTVPAKNDYMLNWKNPSASPLPVVYSFLLTHPSRAASDPVTPLHLALLVAPVVAAFGYIALHSRRMQGRLEEEMNDIEDVAVEDSPPPRQIDIEREAL